MPVISFSLILGLKAGNKIESLSKTFNMKKFMALMLLISFIGCNGNSNETSTTSDTTTSEVGGVENVNGNIPDTTSMGATPNSGDNQPRIDSSYADTAKKTAPR